MKAIVSCNSNATKFLRDARTDPCVAVKDLKTTARNLTCMAPNRLYF